MGEEVLVTTTPHKCGEGLTLRIKKTARRMIIVDTFFIINSNLFFRYHTHLNYFQAYGKDIVLNLSFYMFVGIMARVKKSLIGVSFILSLW